MTRRARSSTTTDPAASCTPATTRPRTDPATAGCSSRSSAAPCWSPSCMVVPAARLIKGSAGRPGARGRPASSSPRSTRATPRPPTSCSARPSAPSSTPDDVAARYLGGDGAGEVVAVSDGEVDGDLVQRGAGRVVRRPAHASSTVVNADGPHVCGVTPGGLTRSNRAGAGSLSRRSFPVAGTVAHHHGAAPGQVPYPCASGYGTIAACGVRLVERGGVTVTARRSRSGSTTSARATRTRRTCSAARARTSPR